MSSSSTWLARPMSSFPGHRIRVDITSSHFPQFDRNPNTGEDLGASDKVRIARQTVFHSADKPSHILLPVVEVPVKEPQDHAAR